MSEEIFSINGKKNKTPEKTVEVFTFWGKHDYEDIKGYPMINFDDVDEIFNMSNAYAIRITSGARIRYYVKVGKYGRLFNPIGLYSEGNVDRQLRHAGRPEWIFKTTNENVFNYYIKFLKTKNTAWLNNAEREI